MPLPLYGYTYKAGKVVQDPQTWAVVLGVLSSPTGGGFAVVQRMTNTTKDGAQCIVTRIRKHARFYREGRPFRNAAPEPRLSAIFALAGEPPQPPPPTPRKSIAKRSGSKGPTPARGGQGRRIA